MQNAKPEVWFDVSRMLWRVFRGTMTGIDRVDIAYAEHFLEAIPDRIRFVAIDYWTGSFRMLPDYQIRRMIIRVSKCWHDGTLETLRISSGLLLVRSVLIAPLVPKRRRDSNRRTIYVNTSMHPTQWPLVIGRMLKRAGAVFVPMIHDLIPLEHPEYVPPAWTNHHRARLETAIRYAGGIIANSETTGVAIEKWTSGRIPIMSSRIGVTIHDIRRTPYKQVDDRPYFVCLGTLEPRKNHMVLLHVWRRMVERYGEENTPRLLIIGRRGWENEHVLDMLERCDAIRNVVTEMGILSDEEVGSILLGSRALLMPSFIEGYGLPVAEAMGLGVPVICSDISAHREIGGDIPVFLDPLDGPGWEKAVMSYSAERSSCRTEQTRKLAQWNPPKWSDHMKDVVEFIESIAASEVERSHTVVGHERIVMKASKDSFALTR